MEKKDNSSENLELPTNINYNNDNTIIFTISRMNPPTPGHMLLVKKLVQEAISKNINHVYIILSKTDTNKDNPLHCPEKIDILGSTTEIGKTMIQSLKQQMILEISDKEIQQKINEINIITICVAEEKGATPFNTVYSIINNMIEIPNINLSLIIGDDRKNLLDNITDTYFNRENIFSVNGIILPRENMDEYKLISTDPNALNDTVMSDIPTSAISASFVRNVVNNERFDKFSEIYKEWLDEDKIHHLYDIIKTRLSELPIVKKREAPEKPLKYDYPMIKGISDFIIPSAKRKRGGKRKTKKRSKSKSNKSKKRSKSKKK